VKRNLLIAFCLIFFAFEANAQIFSVGSNRREVALTFDDGPSGKYTEMVLNTLKKYNAKATFFIIGRKAIQYPEQLKKLAADGHELGNHTFFHSRLNWISDAKLLDEIEMTTNFISGITKKRCSIFRAPHGYLSLHKAKLIEQKGYKIIQWSINAGDFYRTKSGVNNSDLIYKKVMSRVRGGDIILMHDVSQQTVNALPRIIKNLTDRGYKFVTVSRLLGLNI